MFQSMWRRFHAWRTRVASPRRPARRNRTILRLEALEARETPTANFTATITTSNNINILTLTKVSGDTTITFTNSGTFQEFTVSGASNTTFNGGGSSYTTAKPVESIVLNLGAGNDSVTFDGSQNTGTLSLPGNLTINGTSGNKTIGATQLYLLGSANLKISLTGTGLDAISFVDCNINGTATISHTGIGNTAFAIDTSTNNPDAVNHWGSLSITNGTGSDVNAIRDTDFAGNVIIKNNAGATSATGPGGGSFNTFAADNNTGILTVTGSVTVTTTTGQSDTEINDYNVHGTLTVNTGLGIANQNLENFIGIENKPTNPGTIPVFGSVSLTGSTVNGLGPGLSIDVGTPKDALVGSGNDFPVTITKSFSALVNGIGSAHVLLNDLLASTASVSITLASTTSGNTVNVLGDNSTSYLGSLTISSLASGNSNLFDLQPVIGTLDVAGAVSFKMGNAPDQIFVGSPNNNANASLVLNFGSLSFSGTGGNKKYSVQNTNLGSLNMLLTGTGSETSTYTDVNVTNTATIKTSGNYNTSFSIVTSNLNSKAMNNWGSLAITNGFGADTNSIQDTDFSGNVTIANGPGQSLNKGQFGGSETLLFANNYKGLLTIAGNLSISTTGGQSDTEVNDYNVHGSAAITTGIGITGQNNANFVGIENNMTIKNAPVIGGLLTVTGSTVSSQTPGLVVDLGTTYPITLHSGLTVGVTGTGSAQIILQDLTVDHGTTSVTFGSLTSNNNLQVYGKMVTSVYSAFNITSSSTSGTSVYQFQDQKGTLQIDGLVKWKFGNANTILDLAADSGNTGGVKSALLEFYPVNVGLTPAEQFIAGIGSNQLFGAINTNLFFVTPPVRTNI
jgi:hypothetical protein